jgi:hypothetical protein
LWFSKAVLCLFSFVEDLRGLPNEKHVEDPGSSPENIFLAPIDSLAGCRILLQRIFLQNFEDPVPWSCSIQK